MSPSASPTHTVPVVWMDDSAGGMMSALGMDDVDLEQMFPTPGLGGLGGMRDSLDAPGGGLPGMEALVAGRPFAGGDAGGIGGVEPGRRPPPPGAGGGLGGLGLPGGTPGFVLS